jgi:UDP-N-acetylmuramate: L-alanyl-gamma-D-glutamyl-meso-diaminopimelate ligase
MNGPYLQQDTCSDLFQVSPSGKIHLVGVCGVAMGALALALADMGYEVSGSDKEFYPPMSELLKQSSVRLIRGFSAENITPDVQLCVIGNSVPSTNIEVQAIEQQRLPHTFFARIAGELIQGGRRGIVVAGTHGKTTTTALLAYGFTKLHHNPSYFVGGDIPQLSSSFVRGDGDIGIIEGDEYDSVFYVKRPKFLFYKPDILILNALEFDHADIYSSLEDIEKEFAELIERVPSHGSIIACADYPSILNLVQGESSKQVITFGRSSEANYCLESTCYEGVEQIGTISGPDGSFELVSPFVGEMNMLNSLAAYLAASVVGVQLGDWIEATRDFIGVSRRLQQRYHSSSVTLLEDFAHHPTAVREVIEALKSRYPQSSLWVAFEPRSNTSRRAIFQQEYEESFVGVDRLFVREVQSRYTDQNEVPLNLAKVQAAVEAGGTVCEIHPDGASVESAILSHLEDPTSHRQSTIIVLMSNGAFDGLSASLSEKLEQREQ